MGEENGGHRLLRQKTVSRPFGAYEGCAFTGLSHPSGDADDHHPSGRRASQNGRLHPVLVQAPQAATAYSTNRSSHGSRSSLNQFSSHRSSDCVPNRSKSSVSRLSNGPVHSSGAATASGDRARHISSSISSRLPSNIWIRAVPTSSSQSTTWNTSCVSRRIYH